MRVELLIEKIRKEKGISQEKLAKLSGISAAHISYLERGERRATINVLVQIAKALNVDEKELYRVKR